MASSEVEVHVTVVVDDKELLTAFLDLVEAAKAFEDFADEMPIFDRLRARTKDAVAALERKERELGRRQLTGGEMQPGDTITITREPGPFLDAPSGEEKIRKLEKAE